MTPPIVKRYLIAFDQYKWTGLGAFGLVVGASLVFSIQPIPPAQFEAVGILSYTRPPLFFSKTGTDLQQQAQTSLTPQNLLQESVLRAAAEQLKLKNPKQLLKVSIRLPASSSQGGKEKGAAPSTPSQFLVQYSDTNPKQAQEIVNTLMKLLVEQSSINNKRRLRVIIDEINKRLPKAESQLRQAENQLEEYTKREGTLLLAAQNGTILQGITGSQAQQRQIEFQLQGIEAQILSLQQRLGLTADQAYTSSALSADPIIANLRGQIYQVESQLALLSKDYRAEHPNVVALSKQKQIYEKMLQERAAEVIGNNGIGQPLQSSSRIRQDSSLDPSRQQLAQQLVALKMQQDTLKQQQIALVRQEQKLRREYLTIPNKQLEQLRLQQKVQLKQDLYSKMQASLADAQAAEAETIGNLFIDKPAQVIALPQEGKNVLMIIGIGAGVGIVVGGGLIFLLGMLGGVLETMEEIRSAMTERDIEVLGVLPYMFVPDAEESEIPVILSADSPYLELYERLRGNLRRAGEQPPKVVLFTSTINEEGKSLSAYNLAIASARAGKRTLLIEADLRSPSFAKAVRVAPDPDASVEPLRYYGSLSECTRLVPDVENLYVVPSPGPVRQPAAILESSEFRRLIEDARGRFDLVILDSAALSLCNDTMLIEPLTDGMVLVTRPGYTGGSMLAEAADQLNESEDITLLGAIINGADMRLPTPVATEELSEEAPTKAKKPAAKAKTKVRMGGRKK